MDEKRADPKVAKEVAGDPAFYNDQIGNNNEPMKANFDKITDGTTKKEWPNAQKEHE